MTIAELENRLVARDGKAMCELGRRYRYGTDGAEQNYTMAYRMYHKAEKQNEKDAFLALGQMYENGEYFSKSIDIATEYYQKAGESMLTNPELRTVQTTVLSAQSTSQTVSQPSDGSGNQSATISKIKSLLVQAETCRNQGNTSNAKNYVQQASRLIKQQGSALGDYQRQANADVNWMMAFIAFNEKDYNSFFKYVNDPSVYEFHPRIAYLLTVVHQMTNADASVYYQDKQILLDCLNNPRLLQADLADILGMLGDLCLQGVSTSGVDPIVQAHGFYTDAASEGNQYAVEQLRHFKNNFFGKLTYK